jgi:hypothetical protein
VVGVIERKRMTSKISQAVPLHFGRAKEYSTYSNAVSQFLLAAQPEREWLPE